MKKRVLVFTVLLLILSLAAVGRLFQPYWRTPRAYKHVASLTPAEPLAYFSSFQLQRHLEHLLISPRFKAFQKTPWGQDVASRLNAFLYEMPVNPMRAIGAEWALGVYQAAEGEHVPGLLMVSKVDALAGILERAFYLFKRISGQIHPVERIEGIPVYLMGSDDLSFPLYYSVFGDLWMLSTSKPLVKATLRQALSAPTTEEEPSLPFLDTQAYAQERFLTGYWEPARFVDEMRRHDIADESVLDEMASLPMVRFALNVEETSLSLCLDLSSPEEGVPNADFAEQKSVQEANSSIAPSEKLPVVAGLYQTHLGVALRTLEMLFPIYNWTNAQRWNAAHAPLWGEVIECRLASTVLGTLYAVPDVSCVMDTRNAQQAFTFFDETRAAMFEKIFPSTFQRRTMVSTVLETYRERVISTSRLLLQEMLSYAVYAADDVHPQRSGSYAVLATGSERLKTEINSLEASSGYPPYVFMGTPIAKDDTTIPIGRVWMHTVQCIEWLEALSETSTFSLIFPERTFAGLYHALPTLYQSRFLLPPRLSISADVRGAQFSITLRIEDDK